MSSPGMALRNAVRISPNPPSGLTVAVGSTDPTAPEPPTPDPETPDLAEAAFPSDVSN
nr:hypothetical protein [Brevibacterium iodinum]